MREPFTNLPRSLQAFTIGAIGVYLAALLIALPHMHGATASTLMVLFAAASAIKPIPHPRGGIVHPVAALMVLTAVLWDPQDTLAATGVGSLTGLLLFRRVELWRAAINGTGWALSGAAAGVAAHRALVLLPHGVLSVIVATQLAAVTNRLVNAGIFSTFRGLRHRRSCLHEWSQSVTLREWLTEFSPVPLLTVLAVLATDLATPAWRMILTGAYLPVLPVPRWTPRPTEGDRTAGEMTRSITQSLTAPRCASSGRLPADVHTSGGFSGKSPRSPMERVAARILAAAEMYDAGIMKLQQTRPRASPELVERELVSGAGADPDSRVVAALLHVAAGLRMTRNAHGGVGKSAPPP